MYGVSYADLGKFRKRIKVDHGETSCRTPDAVAYIKKANARRRKKKR
jgi:hypothetical protein